MKTRTIGEVLQAERLRHHVDIEMVAERTKIRREYLVALEGNAFDELPAAPFVKGFIQSYAQIFGIEYQPLFALLRRDYKESAAGRLVPRAFLKPMMKKRELWTPVTLTVIIAGVIFMTLVGYVGFQWYQVQRPPELSLSQPEENAIVPSTVHVKGKTVDDAIITVNAQPVAIQPQGLFETDVSIPREGIHTITVEVADRRGKKAILQRTVHVRDNTTGPAPK